MRSHEPGGHRANGPMEGSWGRDGSPEQVGGHCFGVDRMIRDNALEGLDLGCERNPVSVVADVERLDAERVSCE